MEILWGYGMDHNMELRIAQHWYNQSFVPKASRFLGVGLAQG